MKTIIFIAGIIACCVTFSTQAQTFYGIKIGEAINFTKCQSQFGRSSPTDFSSINPPNESCYTPRDLFFGERGIEGKDFAFGFSYNDSPQYVKDRIIYVTTIEGTVERISFNFNMLDRSAGINELKKKLGKPTSENDRTIEWITKDSNVSVYKMGVMSAVSVISKKYLLKKEEAARRMAPKNPTSM